MLLVPSGSLLAVFTLIAMMTTAAEAYYWTVWTAWSTAVATERQ